MEKLLTFNFQLSTIQEAAQQFVQAMQGRTVFAFHGAMGAGKTTFIKAICEALGVRDDVVASPTFAIVNEYQADGPFPTIFHFDFYRIRRLEEAVDMGFDDYLYSGSPCFIEWPELVEPLLPEDTVNVEISEQPDGSRQVTLS
ncbi:MAG: tRNA (adenosine(37)-N6)-threonylcarbamoyltransferase complex ATPase subunit type 1 TsaE [Bacteroidaceae bacterium]|nr:tRNA (adenosine(37)-N6)-threonylcarbamoyltransferase complex ATPase subunit type 1 TsaE [Bacteroidaceae bacterium]